MQLSRHDRRGTATESVGPAVDSLRALFFLRTGKSVV